MEQKTDQTKLAKRFLTGDAQLTTYEQRKAFLCGKAYMQGLIWGAIYRSLALDKKELMEGNE